MLVAMITKKQYNLNKGSSPPGALSGDRQLNFCFKIHIHV